MWNADADEWLRENYGLHAAKTLAKIFTKTFGIHVSPNTIKHRASTLGLEAASNQGLMTIAEAARTLQFDRRSLRSLLCRRGWLPKRSAPYTFISPEVVERLRAEFAAPPVATISVTEAAERLICTPGGVRQMVRRGHLPGWKFGSRVRVCLASVELARLKILRRLA